MTPLCFNCKNPLPFPAGTKVGRKEECLKCHSDVHCCQNCNFYDHKSYNECREPQADRVVEKDRSNFCDYFSLSGSSDFVSAPSKSDILKKLDDLFK